MAGDDKSAHSALAASLVKACNCPVLVPNYRLTPHVLTEDNQFRHPKHAEDVLKFLVFLTTWEGIPNLFDPTGRPMFLMGHSAGAHMLAAIFLDSSAFTPSLTPPPAVLQLVKGIALSEGIFDIDLLLARFPPYREWFIAPAFGDLQSYAGAATTRLPLRDGASLKWLIVHSRADTLVDVPQSDAMYAHLRALYGAAADTHVASNFDEIEAEHDDVLGTQPFIDGIRSFVTGQ